MLQLVVFICGAVVMILELAGSRILAPYFGSSIIVWTGLIGVLLGALSVGYWWGGRLADRKPEYKVLSAIIGAAGFFTAAVALSKSLVLDYLQHYSGHPHLPATFATLILFAPPGMLLGMVSPFAVRLKLKDLNASGRIAGMLYAISSAGSIFGTFVGGFFLIGYVGSTNILFILAIILGICSLLISGNGLRLKTTAVFLYMFLFGTAHIHDKYMAAAGFHDIDTDYGRVFVYESVDRKEGFPMRVMTTHPKAVQSAMSLTDSNRLVIEYTKYFELVWHFQPKTRTLLMLGGGGFSFPKYALAKYPDVSFDVVELDPGITDLARRFFHLKDHPRLSIYHKDARMFLNRSSRTYDAILVDTFNSDYSIPAHLTTRETVKQIYEALNDKGLAMINVLSSIEGIQGRFLRAELATYRSVFPQVYLFPITDPSDGQKWQNVMFAAFKSADLPSFVSPNETLQKMLTHLWLKKVPDDVPLLTDDFAPVERYMLKSRS